MDDFTEVLAKISGAGNIAVVLLPMEDLIKNMWPWTTKPVLSNMGTFVAIAKNILYIFVYKEIDFLRSCTINIFFSKDK